MVPRRWIQVEGNALQGICFPRHCRFVPQGRFDKGRNPLGEWQDKWHADWVPRGRIEECRKCLRKRQRDLPKRILTRLTTVLKIKERLDVLQIIILGLATRTSDFCMGHFCK